MFLIKDSPGFTVKVFPGEPLHPQRRNGANLPGRRQPMGMRPEPQPAAPIALRLVNLAESSSYSLKTPSTSSLVHGFRVVLEPLDQRLAVAWPDGDGPKLMTSRKAARDACNPPRNPPPDQAFT